MLKNIEDTNANSRWMLNKFDPCVCVTRAASPCRPSRGQAPAASMCGPSRVYCTIDNCRHVYVLMQPTTLWLRQTLLSFFFRIPRRVIKTCVCVFNIIYRCDRRRDFCMPPRCTSTPTSYCCVVTVFAHLHTWWRNIINERNTCRH